MDEWFSINTPNNDVETLQTASVAMTSVPHKAQPEGLLSTATAHVIQSVVEVGILPELVLAGVTMNIINMAVFLRQGLSDRINLCLFSLAISDTGYILTLMVTRLHNIFRFFDPLYADYWQLRCLSLIGIYGGFQNTSNCLTLLISLERCLLVISPLKARTMLSTRNMAVIIVITFSVCLAYQFPSCFKFDVITITDPKTNVTTHKAVFSQWYTNHVDIFENAINILDINIQTITFLGVAFTTSAIAVRMRAVSLWRQRSASDTTETERKEASVTRMLFVICIMYTICTIPSAVRPVVNLLVPEFQPGKRYHNLLFTSISLMHLMASINSSFNFVIYYVMSTRFRDTFKELFKRCKLKKRNVEMVTKAFPGHRLPSSAH